MSTPTMQDVADLMQEVEALKAGVRSLKARDMDLEARVEEVEESKGLLDDQGDEYDDIRPQFVGESSAFDELDPHTLRVLANAIEEMEAER